MLIYMTRGSTPFSVASVFRWLYIHYSAALRVSTDSIAYLLYEPRPRRSGPHVRQDQLRPEATNHNICDHKAYRRCKLEVNLLGVEGYTY
jgi:hypothetical protein